MIYVVRHGQTTFNAEGRMQGHLDSPLTALGIRQAEAMADLLDREIADKAGWSIIASPLGRTRHTAQIIASRLGLSIEIEPRIIEVSFGSWDGWLRSDLRSQFPEIFNLPEWQVESPDGETYDGLHGRIADWLGSLPPESERKLIAVCHGGSGRMIRGGYLGLDRTATWQQEVPQDAVFALAGGRETRLDCTPVPTGGETI